MFCKNCGNEIKGDHQFCMGCGNQAGSVSIKARSNFFAKNKFITAIVIPLTLTFLAIFYFNTTRSVPSLSKEESLAAAVVNIYCMGAGENSVSGGSGTILSEDGLVLTNAHIIPSDYKEGTNDCMVILPDPTNGSPKEMYIAYPIVVPALSEQYDLAFVQIQDVYYDKEKERAYGEYPKKFPSYAGEQCRDQNVKLGEPIRIYGYPALSGGYALTITDGIVSSLLPDEGYIITSAKISHGNSGGLAVDANGCMVGVPSMVSSDETESLGVIISVDTILKFVAAL